MSRENLRTVSCVIHCSVELYISRGSSWQPPIQPRTSRCPSLRHVSQRQVGHAFVSRSLLNRPCRVKAVQRQGIQSHLPRDIHAGVRKGCRADSWQARTYPRGFAELLMVSTPSACKMEEGAFWRGDEGAFAGKNFTAMRVEQTTAENTMHCL